MKYGAALKNLHKAFSELFFNKKNSVNLHDWRSWAKQISKTQPKIVEITPREGVCRRLESDMQI